MGDRTPSSGFWMADGELVTYYDGYGNPVRTIADNHMGGKEVFSSRFKYKMGICP